MRENVVDVPPMEVITKDNVAVTVDAFSDRLFLQMSTDEICRFLPDGKRTMYLREDAMLAPRNLYSASKASAELYTMAYLTHLAISCALPAAATTTDQTNIPRSLPLS